MTTTPRSIPTQSKLLALGLSTLLLAGVARADALPAESADPKAEARTLTDTGLRKFQVGDYLSAIADFKQAYLLDPQPPLLYNIAQAHRLHRDCAEARRFYANFLHDKPDAPNRDAIETRIDEMKKCADEQAKAQATSPQTGAVLTPGVKEAVIAQPITTPPPKQHGRAWKAVGIASIVVGAALVGAGIGTSVVASSDAKKVGDLFAMKGASWDASHASDQTNGQRAATASIPLFVVGGAAIVVGSVLTALAFPPKKRGHVDVAISTTGVSAGYSCAF